MTERDSSTAPSATDQSPTGDRCGCGCGCGQQDGGTGRKGLPVVARPRAEVEAGDLDLRPLPPQERHARALDAVAGLLPGEGVVIAAPHDPAPLRQLLAAADTGTLGWTYLTTGPEVWRVQVSRETCC